MILSISVKREFVPEFNNNKKLPAADQIKIEHKAATATIKESLFPRRFQLDKDGGVTSEFEIDRKKIIQAFVTGIKNLGYEVEGEEKNITTVEQLFKAPIEFDPLIEELYTYFNEMLNARANEKN
jgi:hypothetical protein